MRWPERELVLCVGDTVEIGDVRITLVDVDGHEVCFHIENDAAADWDESPSDESSELPR